MTPEAAIRELQGLAHDHKAAHGYLAPYPQQWRNVEAHADTLRDIARLIESLQSERDALAEQVVQMREALETLNHAAKVAISSCFGAHEDDETPIQIRLLDGTCDATDEYLADALRAAREASDGK